VLTVTDAGALGGFFDPPAASSAKITILKRRHTHEGLQINCNGNENSGALISLWLGLQRESRSVWTLCVTLHLRPRQHR
jgi:hypothetical protein